MQVKKRKNWKNHEIEFLLKSYSSLGLNKASIFLKRSSTSVAAKVRRMKIKLSPSIISEIRINERERRFKTTINDEDFYDLKNPEIIYLLGFLWADGSIHHATSYHIALKIVSNDFKDINSIFERNGKWLKHIVKPKFSHHQEQTITYVNHKKLFQWLQNLGYDNKKTPIKILKLIPNNLKHYWWRGYFDGDGCLYINTKNREKYVCISSNGDQDWSFFKKQFKGFTIIKQTFVHGRNSRIQAKKISTINHFLKYIYKGQQFGLTRKFNKYSIFKDLFIK